VIHAYSFDNPVDAHDGMCERMIWGDNSNPNDIDYDWTHGTEVGLHNVSIHCKTIDFEYNLKDLWIPPSRWAMMVRQYIDPEALEDCLAKVEERMAGNHAGRKARGIAVLRTRLVQGKGTGRGVRRRWGSCMLNLSFRRNPIPTVTLNSRTTYFGYLALVDIAVARTFAKQCAEITGVPLTDVEFVWHLDLAQFHGFRSLAWVLMDEDIREDLDNALPHRLEYSSQLMPGNTVGWRKVLDGYHRIKKSDDAGTLYGDESFSSFARVRRRFHTEAFGMKYASQFEGGTRNRGGKAIFAPLPDLWVSSLDFSCLDGRRIPNPVGPDWDEDDEED
jgi:hypothetical protein